ncbi:MAG: Peptidase family S41-like protein [Mucilaginibacter sp.]|nr:Peptidase family S41-like protein [Mucilaginibacter sp.]
MAKLNLCFALLILASASRSQVPNTLNPADKIYGLSRFWQEVNYNFVYLNRIDNAKWDSTYRSMIKEVEETPDDYTYYRSLQKFCAMLKDGHTHIEFPPQIDSMLMVSMFDNYRVKLKNFNGKAIVYQTSLSAKDLLPLGSEVVEVNHLPTKMYIEKYVAPYIATSTSYAMEDQCVYNLLEGFKGQTFTITIKTPQSKLKTIQLTHGQSGDQKYYPNEQNDDKTLDFKWLGHNIAYLGLNSFADPSIVSLFKEKLPELYKAKSLIIDLRKNGGGNDDFGYAILQYLTHDKSLNAIRSSTRQHLGVFKAWGSDLAPKDTARNETNKRKYLDAHNEYYYSLPYWPLMITNTGKKIVVPVVVLMGHNTASAAEDFLIATDNQKHIIKMGERSNGSTGQPYVFTLPGGGTAYICTKKDTYFDGREFVGYGVKPDIEVEQSINDFVKGQDTALIKAIDYLIKNK